MKKNFKSGFTLIEMAIVVIIIGVIIAGVLGGQELLEVNKRNSLITDLKKYSDATLQFKDKYRFLPGDYPYAAETFPEVSDGNGNYNYYSANGDGDGNISFQDTRNVNPIVSEETLAFSQLGRAGFIKENFGGFGEYPTDTSKFWFKDGVVVPKSSYKGVHIRYLDFVNRFSNLLSEPIILSSAQILTSIAPGSFTGKIETYKGFTSVENVYKIDEKMDDKNPATGNIINYVDSSTGTTCSTWDNSNPTASTYNLADTAAENCTLLYLINND